MATLFQGLTPQNVSSSSVVRAAVAFLVSRTVPVSVLVSLETVISPGQRRLLCSYIAEFVLLFSPLTSASRRALLQSVAQRTASAEQVVEFVGVLLREDGRYIMC